MTINNAQGQIFSKVGIYMHVFPMDNRTWHFHRDVNLLCNTVTPQIKGISEDALICHHWCTLKCILKSGCTSKGASHLHQSLDVDEVPQFFFMLTSSNNNQLWE